MIDGQAAGDGLDRRERVVHLVADDADQALKRLPLFFSQRTTQIREHQQLVGASTLPELAAPHFPSPRAGRERRVDDARGITGQVVIEGDLVGAAAEQTFCG